MAKEKGWIYLDRKIFDNWMYSDKPFNKSMAWIDLLLLADYSTSEKLWRGNMTTFKRGDVNISILELSKRWGWSRDKVRRFLSALEKDNAVRVKATTNKTTITIVNYEVFQTKRATDNTTNKATKRTSDKATDNTHLNNNKRINKENKRNIDEPSANSVEEDDDEGWLTPDEAYKLWKEQQQNAE